MCVTALAEFEEMHLGKLSRDEDARGKPHYQVVAISCDEKPGGKCWERVVAPVSLLLCPKMAHGKPPGDAVLWKGEVLIQMS